MLWVSLFWSAVPVVFYIVGGLAVLDGRATIGTVVAFVGYSALLFGPVVGVVDGYLEVRRSLVPLNRIFEYLDAAEVRAETQSTSLAEPGITGDIRFEDVSYVYKDGTKAVDAVSFEVRAGQTVAVVGRSGSGKTTLAYLISRIYEPTSGTVMLDRMDTRRLSLQTLTESISMVTQEAALFNCSIEENLRYAKPDATDLELRRACRAVHLEELIAKLPDGLATRIGDRGFRFSGGERQRLAIARILLRDPRVLIFDEATSALDRQSEYHLQQALSNALQGRTKFVIAHRLATIANADLVLVLEHGAIVSRGKLGDLVKRRDPALLRLFSDELSGGSQSVEAVFGVSS
jgi:ATP-binding cassette subfamily B protein